MPEPVAPLEPGTVYLVGAGPGDPGLITVMGRACVRGADIILRDRLLGEAILEEARPEAVIIDAGKRAGDPGIRQQHIHELLARHARAGKIVVRLKGGDPFTFGRGGEEAAYLAARGIPFVVVPGITAATAVAAYAGIPLTHRGLSSSVGLATGHEDPAKAASAVEWTRLADAAGTLVLYMAFRNLDQVVAQLQRRGMAADHPIAVIAEGTTPRQRTVVGTLADIGQRVRAAEIRGLSLVVVGPVATLHDRLNWFEQRPLFGKRIVVTRPRHQAGTLTALLRSLGADALEFPVIQTVPPASWEAVDAVMADLATVDWIVFTSANGVDAFMERLFATGRDIRALGRARIAAIGPATAERVAALHLHVALLPEVYVGEALAEALGTAGDIAGSHVLLPRADIARAFLPAALTAAGARVTEVTVYRTVAVDDPPPAVLEAIGQGAVDFVTFTSSSTVRHFAALLERAGFADRLPVLSTASIGPVTSGTLREHGMPVTVEAAESTVAGLVQAIRTYSVEIAAPRG